MRITNVKAARKPQGTCGSCGDAINVGDPYRWIKPRYGAKRIRCMKPECAFRQSDLTSNDKLATVYGAVEAAHDAVGAWGEMSPVDDLTSALEDAAEQIRGAGEEWTESAEAIREHFSESEQADTAEENAEMAEEFAQQLEEVKDEVETLEPEEGETPTKKCPDCGDKYEEWAAEFKATTVFPPRAATHTIKARDLTEGLMVVDRHVANPYAPTAPLREVMGLQGPMKHHANREDVANRADYEGEWMMFRPHGGSMMWWVPADETLEILPDDITWYKAGKDRWVWKDANDEVIGSDAPAFDNDCETCGGTGEVPLDDPDEWREEAKSMVEGVLQEMPL